MKNIVFYLMILAVLGSCKTRTSAEKVAAEEAKKAGVASGTEYNLNTDVSILKWTGSKPGGEHHGTVKITEGKINSINGTITAGNFVIDLNTIVNEDLTDPEMNAKLVGHLKSQDFFHVDEYPSASFEIVSVTRIDNPSAPASGGLTPTHNVTGNLTMRGTVKSISFPAKIDITGSKIKAHTNPFAINRTEWNVNFMSKSLFAELKDNFIDDNIIIQLELEFDEAS